MNLDGTVDTRQFLHCTTNEQCDAGERQVGIWGGIFVVQKTTRYLPIIGRLLSTPTVADWNGAQHEWYGDAWSELVAYAVAHYEDVHIHVGGDDTVGSC